MRISTKTKRCLKLIIPMVIIIFFLVVAMFPQLFTRYSYTKMNVSRRLEGPSSDFWFGTDQFGRDIYSRIVVGTRVSYSISIGAVVIAIIGGVVLGVAGGVFKTMGFLVMRLVDVLLCFPPIIAAIFALSLVKPGVLPLIFIIGFLYAPRMARVVQGAVLDIAQAPYIEAQRAVGANLFRIVWRGILPQIIAPMVVQATIMLATAMLLEAGLSFLALGIPPPTPTWGGLVSEARRSMHLNISSLIYPAAILSLNIIFINLLGDGLRDNLDPKLRGV
ncbi:ABC transporter permease [archaeon]|nr:MAG: ABC transporter permease [archaeon]